MYSAQYTLSYTAALHGLVLDGVAAAGVIVVLLLVRALYLDGDHVCLICVM
jgi:hypothetical protein